MDEDEEKMRGEDEAMHPIPIPFHALYASRSRIAHMPSVFIAQHNTPSHSQASSILAPRTSRSRIRTHS